MTSEGDGVSRADGWWQGGDGNSPATQDIEASRDSSSSEEIASGLGPAVPPSPQQGTAAGRCSEVSTHRYPDGADISRP